MPKGESFFFFLKGSCRDKYFQPNLLAEILCKDLSQMITFRFKFTLLIRFNALKLSYLNVKTLSSLILWLLSASLTSASHRIMCPLFDFN